MYKSYRKCGLIVRYFERLDEIGQGLSVCVPYMKELVKCGASR